MAKVWSGVQVAVQSSLATALPISAITKASPAVATYTGADPTEGDYLYLSDIQGMYQLNERVVRAGTVNAGSDTVQLAGVDSTLYSTFTSGDLQVVTFGTTLSLITDITVSGGDFEDPVLGEGAEVGADGCDAVGGVVDLDCGADGGGFRRRDRGRRRRGWCRARRRDRGWAQHGGRQSAPRTPTAAGTA
jgi:hypothetical protein